MNNFKVSVIIPVYNAEAVITDALSSVVRQTLPDPIEVIVINDGSTDRSGEIVEHYIRTYSTSNRNIKIITTRNQGVSAARNIGLRAAKGQYIALLDSDDEWEPEKLAIQLHAMSNNTNIYIIGSNVNNENGFYPFFGKNKLYMYSLNTREVLLKWWPLTPTIVFNRTILDIVSGYDEKMHGAEDGDFELRILQHFQIYVINKNLVRLGHGKKQFGDSGLSSNLSVMYKGEIRAAKKACDRKQINSLEYLLFIAWFSIKYIRRRYIIIIRRRRK